jgi:diguanylate cyclase (GGDEF)-like protein
MRFEEGSQNAAPDRPESTTPWSSFNADSGVAQELILMRVGDAGISAVREVRDALLSTAVMPSRRSAPVADISPDRLLSLMRPPRSETDRLLLFFRSQPPGRVLGLSLLLTVLLGLVDARSPEIAVGVFYLIPVSLAAYFVADRAAFTVSLACAIAWYVADAASGSVYSHEAIRVWNALTRLAMFLIVSALIGSVRRAWEQQHELANFDYLTGLPNRRRFDEWLQNEIPRARRYRHPFTIAYLDVDDFKILNDYLGHATGDVLLRRVAELLRGGLRETDRVARLGGDEFGLLFPETGYEAAHALIAKLHVTLSEEMKARDWPVSFSVGVVTCLEAPPEGEVLLQQVDEMMYKAKRGGKNAIHHQNFTSL